MMPHIQQQQQHIANAVAHGAGQAAAAVVAAASHVGAVAAGGTDNVVVPTEHDEAMGTKELQEIPKAAEKLMIRAMLSFERNARKFTKAKRRLEHLDNLLQQFEDDKEKQRFPAGTRPFIHDQTLKELEEEWSFARDNDFQLTCMIPKGSLRMDVQRIVYRFSMELQKKDRARGSSGAHGNSRTTGIESQLEDQARRRRP